MSEHRLKANAAKAIGDHRFLISIHLTDGCVAHCYVKCRTRPERNMEAATDRLLKEIAQHGHTPAMPVVLATQVDGGDCVEKIIAPFS